MNYCPTCRVGRLQRRSMVYLEWHGRNLLIVDRMPAIVCDLCGERVYDQDAMEYLQRLLLSNAPESPRVISNRNSYEAKRRAA